MFYFASFVSHTHIVNLVANVIAWTQEENTKKQRTSPPPPKKKKYIFTKYKEVPKEEKKKWVL
jgi:hypothetical protein